MASETDESRRRLEQAAWTLIERSRKDFGFDDATALRGFEMMTSKGSQDRLFGELERMVGSPAMLAKPLRFLEAGCGTGNFLYTMLERGHDAYGIDNDPDRLAVAWEKIDAFGYPAAWRDRMSLGDASRMSYDSDFFDIVMGHQFIEHVDHIPAVLREMLRVTKHGGFIVLWAPDYRAPYEAHYEMPWPPFATRSMAECWVEAFGRPAGGLNHFNYATLPQVAAILQVLGADLLVAALDRDIDPEAYSKFDTSSAAALRQSAKTIQAAMAAGTLPSNFRGATSFAITARKR